MTPEQLDLSVWPIFARMTQRGIRVDVDAMGRLRDEVCDELATQEAALEAFAGRPINPYSTAEVGKWLADEGYAGPKRTRTGAVSTDERALSLLMDQHPLPGCVLECRGLRKLVGTFIDPVLTKVAGMAEPTVHPRWRLTRVKSGRPSCEDPNLLAFPTRDAWGKRVRECFVARPGMRLVSVDFSQVEPRIAAALSGDEALMSVFREERDLYADTARRIFKRDEIDSWFKAEPAKTLYRQPAKIIFLGCVLYGMQAPLLYDELIKWGCGTPSEPFYALNHMACCFDEFGGCGKVTCVDFVRDRFKPYPRLAELSASVCTDARANDGWAQTAGGRKRFLPALLVDGHRWPAAKLREEAERQAFNHLIQGTAQEEMKAAMLRVEKAAMLRVEKAVFMHAHPLLQIYDEMVYEVPAENADSYGDGLAAVMESERGGVKIATGWSVADNWGSLK